MDKFKSIGPNIEPWRISGVMSLKLLFVLLTQTPYFWFFAYEKLKVV